MWLVYYVAVIGYMVLGIYNVVKGRANELPVIGKFRLIKTVEFAPNMNNMNNGAPVNNAQNNMNNGAPVNNAQNNMNNEYNNMNNNGTMQ